MPKLRNLPWKYLPELVCSSSDNACCNRSFGIHLMHTLQIIKLDGESVLREVAELFEVWASQLYSIEYDTIRI